MQLRNLLTAAAIALTFVTGSALAQADKAKKQTELKGAAQTSLAEFYKQKPELKAQTEKAPGYAMFTTYGLSFLIGGAGGKGIVHDNKTKQDTYMEMAQASAGLQVGAAETKLLIIFKDAAAMNKFVTSGWEVGAGAGAGAGAGGKSADAGAGANMIADSTYYMLTKNGVQAGGAVAGTKFWKDKELN